MQGPSTTVNPANGQYSLQSMLGPSAPNISTAPWDMRGTATQQSGVTGAPVGYTAPAAPTTAEAAGAWGTGGANTPYSNTYGGMNYAATNGGQVGTNPIPARATNTPLYRAPITTPAGNTIGASNSASIPLTQAQMDQYQNATGLTGQAFYNALPAPIAPTGVTDDIRNAYNTADANLRAAMQAGTVTPALSQASANATNAFNTAMYGPLWKMLSPGDNGGPMINPANTLGGGGVYVPHEHPVRTAAESEAARRANAVQYNAWRAAQAARNPTDPRNASYLAMQQRAAAARAASGGQTMGATRPQSYYDAIARNQAESAAATAARLARTKGTSQEEPASTPSPTPTPFTQGDQVGDPMRWQQLLSSGSFAALDPAGQSSLRHILGLE